MTAAVLSTGTELTRGELVNTNATWLSEQLTALGFEVSEHLTVDDHEGRIVEAVLRLAGRVKVVVGTGGLGPTTDDLTATSCAKALGVPLVRDHASIDRMRRIFEKLGREMTTSNEKQADLPEGSTVLVNPVGTAPGFAFEHLGTRFFFLPGVPHEMRTIFAESVRPAIAALAPRTTHQIHLRSVGLGESEIQTRLADIEAQHPGVTLGYRATFPEVEVKVHARAANEPDAEALARTVTEIVKSRLGDAVYGDRDDTFPAAVGRALRNRGLTLALAESCTGGLAGAMMTSVPGSSDYLLLDAVTYANSSKTRLLGVSPETLRAHGSVSDEVAAEMAEGALRLADSDLAVSITGVAGPGGGTEQKPVGTVCFAIARRGGPTETHHRHFPGDRERIRKLAAYYALRMVYRTAQGLGIESSS